MRCSATFWRRAWWSCWRRFYWAKQCGGNCREKVSLMKIAQPIFLWLLLIAVPALSAFLFFAWRTKQKLISQFVQSRLLANLTVGVSKTRQKARLVLLALA